MISDEWVNGVTKIASYNISKKFPLLGDKYFKESEVRYILEAHKQLMDEWLNENTKT
jgi:hypothetical protein